jgi:endonuclease/exonuclease/phosphatase (EEP) superfamily protein YafD
MDARADAAIESARPARSTSGGALRKWAVRAAIALSIAYTVGVVVAWILLRFVGESWWISTIGLYLPRLVLGLPLPFLLMALLALRLRRWLWTAAAAAFVLVFPIMGFVLPWPHWGDGGAPRVRVLSYNVNSTNGGVEALLEEVNRFSPDIVLFQESARGEVLEPLVRE